MKARVENTTFLASMSDYDSIARVVPIQKSVPKRILVTVSVVG